MKGWENVSARVLTGTQLLNCGYIKRYSLAFDIISDQLNIIVKFELEINVLPMKTIVVSALSQNYQHRK